MNIAEQVGQIIEHLPGQWTMSQTQEWYATIIRDDDTTLLIELGDKAGKRLSVTIPIISRVTPSGRTEYFHAHRPSITCAVSRGPEAIARDIERRILSAASNYRIKAALWFEAEAKANREQENARARLLALPATVGGYDNTVHGQKWSAKVESAQYVSMQLATLTIDQALAVAAALAAA